MTKAALRYFYLTLAFTFLGGTAITAVRAQSCPPIVVNGGESISAEIRNTDTGGTIGNGAVVPVGTHIQIDVIAAAFGSCTPRACDGVPCVCYNIDTFERNVDHINIDAIISSNSTLNGQYVIGSVWGQNPNGTTAAYHVLDTHAANSSGPVNTVLLQPGTYTFLIGAVLASTVCQIEPHIIHANSVTVYVRSNDEAPNQGEITCNSRVGEPVNVTNGNVYISQTDYDLPGVGEHLQITRIYNSRSRATGLFGNGWSSNYDESITSYGANALRLNLPDGRAVLFTRTSTAAPFSSYQSGDFRGQVVQNTDNSYTLTFKDGRVHQFSSAGKLLSMSDRNNNQTILSYDGNGQLVTITDPFGRSLTFSYTTAGQVSSVSDGLGPVATYSYSFSDPTAITYPDNSQFKFTYSNVQSRNVIATVKDALNNVLESHTYDSQGRALTSERSGGVERYTLNYISNGETDVTDALGHVSKYFFDKSTARNVITRVEGVCACGNGSQVQTWEYDNDLNITKDTDALGRQVTYTYDADANMLTKTDTLGTETYTYNSNRQILTIKDRMNGMTVFTYDANGRLVSSSDPLGNATKFTYDAHGQLLTGKDARGNITALTWDGGGRLGSYRDALGNETNFSYDQRGRVTGVSNALGQNMSYTYDAANRPKRTTFPDNNFIEFTYDLAGRKTRVKDARGNDTVYGYDAAYRLTSMTDPLGHTTLSGYDLMSNRVMAADALGHAANFEYDELNRPKKVIYPPAVIGGSRLEERQEYDLTGNVIKSIDTAGRQTLYDYDAANRLVKITDPALQITQFEYDPNSRMTKITDALNQQYSFTYDPLGRTLSMSRAGTTAAFIYDAMGNRTKRIDHNGQATIYTYNALNQLTAIQYFAADGALTDSAQYSYDALSRLKTAANTTGTVSLTYNTRGRISAVTDVFGKTLNYSYDPNGNKIGLSLAPDVNMTYSYDVANRLTQLSDSPNSNFGFTYNAADDLISITRPNNITSNFDYDGLSRLIRLGHSGGSTNFDYQYVYDTSQHISQIVEQGRTSVFNFDAVDQLSTVTVSGQASEHYSYDAAGNRTASHLNSIYSYQPFNRLAATSSGSYSYDKNGNLTGKADPTGRWHYYYDGENRLIRVAKAGVGYPQNRSVTYRYDALGRRVSRSEKRTGTTEFTLDGLDVIQDRLSKGGVVAQTNYVNGPNLDERLKLSTDTTSQYFLWNHEGSTTALADPNGAITAQTSYDSFGNSTVALPTRYRFTGREADEFTNLIFYRARYYDPQLGRFISEDPIGFGGGVNWYAYAGNNPLEFTDPGGLDKIKVFNTAGGRKIWDGPTYGNWGGKCFSGGLYSCGGNSPGNAPPVDSSDACYKKHDNCYVACGDDEECMAACDNTLYNDLKSLPDDPRDWPFPPVPGTEGQADFFRDLAKLYFQPPQYTYPNPGGRRHQR